MLWCLVPRTLDYPTINLNPRYDRLKDRRTDEHHGTARRFVLTISSRAKNEKIQHTCDLQVASSSPDWAPLCNGLEQAIYTCVPLSPCSTRA